MSLTDPGDAHLWVVYDGECPFCSSYARLYRVRERATVHLIDARSAHPLVASILRDGVDLDKGMAALFNGRFYHGAEAMNLLAVLGSSATFFNLANRFLFGRPTLARRLYPLLVAARLLTLRALRRPLISEREA